MKLTPGKHKIGIKSWGYEDSHRRGYIKMDNATIAELQDQASGHYANMRGLHIVVIPHTTGPGKKATLQRFDIWQSAKEGKKLSEYLETVPEKAYILGGSADEISKNFKSCRPALEALGVDGSVVTYRGSLAFVAQKGNPGFTKQQSSGRNKGPTKLSAEIYIEPGNISLSYIHYWYTF